jgi:tetrahedral aminopeptidase
MFELTPFLKTLLTLPGLSAYEEPVSQVISDVWRPLVNEISASRIGSLHGLRKGTGSEPRQRILIAAHMDAIGLMVTSIDGGLLHITEIGGVDARILPGQPVTVHGRRSLPGVVVQPADHLLPSQFRNQPVDMEYLFVDVGLLPDEVKDLVRPGDLVSFAQEPMELAGNALSGHSLDNRASVAALTYCLVELQHIQHAWDVWAVATAQEEETMIGGLTSPYQIRPQIAIAVDVTFAKGPGTNDYGTYPMGKGLTLGWGPNIHPGLYQAFKELADRLDIPTHMEVMPAHSGTDAHGMQVVAEGIPTMVLGIPLRYMHTPVEEVVIKDIQRTGQLMAEFIARLGSDFMDKLTWDAPE